MNLENNKISDSKKGLLNLKETTGLPLNVCNEIWKEAKGDWDLALSLVKEKYTSLKLKPLTGDISWYHTILTNNGKIYVLSLGYDHDSVLRSESYQNNIINAFNIELDKNETNDNHEEFENIMRSTRQSFSYKIHEVGQSSFNYLSWQNDKIGLFSSRLLISYSTLFPTNQTLLDDLGKEVFSYLIVNNLDQLKGFPVGEFKSNNSYFPKYEKNEIKYQDLIDNMLVFNKVDCNPCKYI